MATPKRILKPLPRSGLRSSWPAWDLNGEFSPRCLNVRFKFGEITPAPGRGLFDMAPSAHFAPQNIGMGPFASSAIQVPYMLTNGALYVRGGFAGGSANTWTRATPGAGSADPTGFGRFGVSAGMFGAVGHVLFTRLCQTNQFATQRTEITDWAPATWPPVFNQISQAVSYEGPSATTDELYALAIAITPGDHVIIANIMEGGTIYPSRVRWSQAGSFVKWDETVQLGAGFQDMNVDSQPFITGGQMLRNDFVVYSTNTITHFEPTGQVGPEFRSDTRVRGVGCKYPFTLASAGSLHFFMGPDHNIWTWDGSSLNNIGMPIQRELAALLTENTLTQLTYYFAMLSMSRTEYWLVIPNLGLSSFDVFVYDFVRNTWSRDSFGSLYALGEIYTSKVSTDIMLLGANSIGATFLIDEQYGYDYFSQGSLMECYLETEDMYIPDPMTLGEHVRTLLMYEFTDSSPFEVGVSFNKGVTWTTKIVTPSTSGFIYIDFGPITGNVIRFRFRELSTDVDFRWTSYAYDYILGGPFIGTRTGPA